MPQRISRTLMSKAPRATKGTCRGCAEPILREDGSLNRLAQWHGECLERAQLSRPGYARIRVYTRDLGICASCKVDTSKLGKYGPRKVAPWVVDHIVPLAEGGQHELHNLQTLCWPCHNVKTSLENRRRGGGGR